MNEIDYPKEMDDKFIHSLKELLANTIVPEHLLDEGKVGLMLVDTSLKIKFPSICKVELVVHDGKIPKDERIRVKKYPNTLELYRPEKCAVKHASILRFIMSYYNNHHMPRLKRILNEIGVHFKLGKVKDILFVSIGNHEVIQARYKKAKLLLHTSGVYLIKQDILTGEKSINFYPVTYFKHKQLDDVVVFIEETLKERYLVSETHEIRFVDIEDFFKELRYYFV